MFDSVNKIVHKYVKYISGSKTPPFGTRAEISCQPEDWSPSLTCWHRLVRYSWISSAVLSSAPWDLSFAIVRSYVAKYRQPWEGLSTQFQRYYVGPSPSSTVLRDWVGRCHFSDVSICKYVFMKYVFEIRTDSWVNQRIGGIRSQPVATFVLIFITTFLLHRIGFFLFKDNAV